MRLADLKALISESKIMKCFYCGKEFILNGKQGGQNRVFCYDCYPEGLSRNEREKLRRELLYKKANDYKVKLGCKKCGYNKYGGVLEWHHKDDNKNFNPGDKLKDGTIKSYLLYEEEIQKCDLYCANCHREWHLEHK